MGVRIVSTEIANGKEEFDLLGHVPVGTLFPSDLSDVTAAGAGLVDVRFQFEDPSGNTYEYTLAPALTVDAGRRRPVRR